MPSASGPPSLTTGRGRAAKELMRAFEAFYHPLPSWANWTMLALMSIAAPVVAGSIHSLCVFQRDFRLYNAEVGGDFFWNGAVGRESLTVAFLAFVCRCLVPALVTFAVLLPLRKRPQICRGAWIGVVVLWTWFLFSAEVATR